MDFPAARFRPTEFVWGPVAMTHSRQTRHALQMRIL
jgi:hypothetical protein